MSKHHYSRQIDMIDFDIVMDVGIDIDINLYIKETDIERDE